MHRRAVTTTPTCSSVRVRHGCRGAAATVARSSSCLAATCVDSSAGARATKTFTPLRTPSRRSEECANFKTGRWTRASSYRRLANLAEDKVEARNAAAPVALAQVNEAAMGASYEHVPRVVSVLADVYPRPRQRKLRLVDPEVAAKMGAFSHASEPPEDKLASGASWRRRNKRARSRSAGLNAPQH